MLTENLKKAEAKRIGKKHRRKHGDCKKEMDAKRQFVLEWFADPQGRSIEDFCTDTKQQHKGSSEEEEEEEKGSGVISPRIHRQFLVRVVSDLDLLALRECRVSDDGMDETVKSLVVSYRPRKSAKDGKNNDKSKEEKDEPVDMDEIKRLMVEFFDDPDMTPLHAFLKGRGALHHKKQIHRLAPLVRLRHLRARREKDDGVRGRVVNGVNTLTQEDLKKKLPPRKVALKKCRMNKCATLKDVKSLLLEYTDYCLGNDEGKSCEENDSKKSRLLPPRAFLRRKGVTSPSIPRGLFLRLAKKLNLEELQNQGDTMCDDKDLTRENIHAKIQSINTLQAAMRLIKSKPNQKCREVPEDEKEEPDMASQSVTTTAYDMDELKSLLIDFFDDEDKAALVPFLKARHVLDRRDVLLQLIQKIHLRKLRNNRHNDTTRDVALAKIRALTEDDLDVPQARIVPVLANVKCPNTSAEPLSLETKKQLLIAFFDEEDETDINTFLRRWGAYNEKKSIVLLMRRIRLRSLRKKRDDPSVRASVMEAISNLAEDNTADSDNDVKSKCLHAALDSEAENSSPDDELTDSKEEDNMQEKLKKLLVDWFFDSDMVSMTLFLRRRNEMALLGTMQNFARVCGLRKLRKDRDDLAVKERVMMKIATLSVPDSPFVDGLDNRKQNEKKQKRPDKTKRKNNNKRETFDALLQEWCNVQGSSNSNTEMGQLSLEEFLEKKGMTDVKEGIELRMKHHMKKQFSRTHCKKAKREKNGDDDVPGNCEEDDAESDVDMDESGPVKVKMEALKLAD